MAMINVDSSEKLPSVLSFCSGYAGIERGFELAGFEHRAIAYVEIESFAIANLVAKMEEGRLVPAPVWSNLKTFPAQIFRDKVDVLTAGYPCQPFSAAGRRQGEDDPRHLWPIIREHIATIRPVRCFFENVEGHISLGLRDVLEDLAGLGYFTTWGIFSASEVGAPHQRKRIFILAYAKHQRFTECQLEAGKGRSSTRHQMALSEGHGAIDANTFGNRSHQISNEGKQSSIEEFVISGEARKVDANTSIKRLEGRLCREITDEEGRKISEVRFTAKRSDRGSWDRHSPWAFEPNLGRVVAGCRDRVDRIRLLGNGVVPQTAAKAWSVLNGRVLDSHK